MANWFEFQSTLPRRERLVLVAALDRTHVISIHAPAKGATSMVRLPLKVRCISIHAPAKGATHRGPRRQVRRPYFNPRSREGSDSAMSRCGS